MNDCLYPHRCAHLRSGTRSGEPCDWCGNHKNTAGLVSAPICKTTGWYETIEDVRARSVHAAIDRDRISLPTQTPEHFARQALMTGK